MKKTFAIVVLSIFTAVTAWMILGSMPGDESPLVIGAPLPDLRYHTPDGSARLAANGLSPTMIVLVHSQCGHCHYQLDRIAEGVEDFGETEIYVLTTEESVPEELIEDRWRRLDRSHGVTWATVSPARFAERFGTLATPAFFIFDGSGRLVHRSVGEARLEYLLDRIATAERTATR